MSGFSYGPTLVQIPNRDGVLRGHVPRGSVPRPLLGALIGGESERETATTGAQHTTPCFLRRGVEWRSLGPAVR